MKLCGTDMEYVEYMWKDPGDSPGQADLDFD